MTVACAAVWRIPAQAVLNVGRVLKAVKSRVCLAVQTVVYVSQCAATDPKCTLAVQRIMAWLAGKGDVKDPAESSAAEAAEAAEWSGCSSDGDACGADGGPAALPEFDDDHSLPPSYPVRRCVRFRPPAAPSLQGVTFVAACELFGGWVHAHHRSGCRCGDASRRRWFDIEGPCNAHAPQFLKTGAAAHAPPGGASTLMSPSPVVVVVVPALPRGAAVEVEVVALTDYAAARTTVRRLSTVRRVGLPGSVLACTALVTAAYAPRSLCMGCARLTVPGSRPESLQAPGILPLLCSTVRDVVTALLETAKLAPATVTHIRLFCSLPGVWNVAWAREGGFVVPLFARQSLTVQLAPHRGRVVGRQTGLRGCRCVPDRYP